MGRIYALFCLSFFFNTLRICLLILERKEEKGEGRGWERKVERERDVRGKHWLVASHTCPRALTGDGTLILGMCSDWGLNLQTFGVWGWRSNQLSHPTRAAPSFHDQNYPEQFSAQFYLILCLKYQYLLILKIIFIVKCFFILLMFQILEWYS